MKRTRGWSWQLVLCVAAVSSVHAADLWLLPEPIAPLPGETVEVRLIEGVQERPYLAERVGLLQSIGRDSRKNLVGEQGKRPFARMESGKPGTRLVVYNGRSRADAVPDRFCKAILVVGDPGDGGPLRWSEVGQRLEIVPQTDPVQLSRAGGRLQLQVLFEREPLAGARVEAVRLSGGVDPRVGRTGEIGLVSLDLARAGTWRVEVTHEARCGDCDGDFRSRVWTASLILAAGGAR